MEPQQLNDLRLRIDAGVEVSNEEILTALRAIRVDRSTRAVDAATKKGKASSPIAIGKIDLAALIAAKTTKASG